LMNSYESCESWVHSHYFNIDELVKN